MNTLLIEPNIAKKTAKITGKVAAGEHVAVTIDDMASVSHTTTLRLRVLCAGRIIAQFPLEDDDAWTVSGDDLTCELNLNSKEARNMCVGPETPILWVIEDIGDDDNDIDPCLYVTEPGTLKGWPGLELDEAPYSLDEVLGQVQKNTDNIATLTTAVGNLDTAISTEIGRATNAEAAITTDYTGKIAALTTQISSTRSILTSETSRAKAAESSLANSIDTKLDKTAQAADSAKLGGVASASYALKSDVPSSVVTSVNGQTNAVVLSASDVGALAATAQAADSAKLNGVEASSYALKTDIPEVPVTSVNGLTGAVTLDADDVGALPLTGGTVTGDLVIGDVDGEDETKHSLMVSGEGEVQGNLSVYGGISAGDNISASGTISAGAEVEGMWLALHDVCEAGFYADREDSAYFMNGSAVVYLPTTSGELALRYTLAGAVDSSSPVLANGEIRTWALTDDGGFGLGLDLGSTETTAADALLYLDATALTEDATLVLDTSKAELEYDFVGEDGYASIAKGKTYILSFTKITAQTEDEEGDNINAKILVAKKELA